MPFTISNAPSDVKRLDPTVKYWALINEQDVVCALVSTESMARVVATYGETQPRMVINLEGGIVQAYECPVDIDLVVVDWEVDNAEEDHTFFMTNEGKRHAWVYEPLGDRAWEDDDPGHIAAQVFIAGREHEAYLSMAEYVGDSYEPELTFHLRDQHGATVEQGHGPVSEVLEKISQFVTLQGTDPDCQGKAANRGAVEFGPRYWQAKETGRFSSARPNISNTCKTDAQPEPVLVPKGCLTVEVLGKPVWIVSSDDNDSEVQIPGQAAVARGTHVDEAIQKLIRDYPNYFQED